MVKTLELSVAMIALLGCLCSADTLHLKDGMSHSGTFVSATRRTISFREGTMVHHYPRSTVLSVEFGDSATATSTVEDNPTHLSRRGRAAVVLPAGTEISVLTSGNIDSKTAETGQVFQADVAEDVTNIDGAVIIPRGSEAELVIRRVSSPGTVTGSSELALDLQSVKVAGHRYRVSTEDIQQTGHQGLGKNKRTAEMVGGGAVLGTLIGAIAGGGKGAAIGAAGGAAAGAGAQVLTRGKAVQVPGETRLRFRLEEPLRLEPAY